MSSSFCLIAVHFSIGTVLNSIVFFSKLELPGTLRARPLFWKMSSLVCHETTHIFESFSTRSANGLLFQHSRTFLLVPFQQGSTSEFSIAKITCILFLFNMSFRMRYKTCHILEFLLTMSTRQFFWKMRGYMDRQRHVVWTMNFFEKLILLILPRRRSFDDMAKLDQRNLDHHRQHQLYTNRRNSSL